MMTRSKRIGRHLAGVFWAVGLGGLLAGCPAEVEEGQADVSFPKDTSPPKDLPLEETGEVAPSDEPLVEILGLVGLDGAGDLFCANQQTVIVGARNIGDRPLRLIINGSLLLDATPVADQAPDRYLITADFSVLLSAEIGLTDGSELTLTAAALDNGAIPVDERLAHTRTFKLDALAPTLQVTSPDTAECPVTLIGEVPITGKVADNRQVGRVEVRFAGDVMGSYPRAEGETTTQTFNTFVDLRLAPSALEPFEIVAYDACGQSTSWACDAKVVRWPWLRTHPTYRLPGGATVNHTNLLDWNDDGFPDALFATTKGLMLVLNGGLEKPGTFHEAQQLTSKPADLVASVDLDDDGELDVVTVERVNGPLSLVVYRHLPDGSLSPEEVRSLGLGSSTKVVDIVVDDFTGDPEGARREDVIIATDNQQQTLILFKRQNADNPTVADQCHEAPVTDASAEEGDTPPATQIVCPALFADPSYAAAVDKVTQVAAMDLPGPDGPDGFLDLVVGVDTKSAIYTFPNRFAQTASLDTSFTISTVSFAWPDPLTSTQPRHFCLGNFIETGVAGDPPDIVVGLEQQGNWRVLRGTTGEVGKFLVSPESQDDPWDVWSMSGTVGGDLSGLVCGDFNLDGHDDFIILSQSSQLLQVHLGNGKGRFNQLPESDLLNPVNEGIGFVIHKDAAKPRVADFDGDGLPDLLVSQGASGFGVYLNRTTAERGFDFDATRALVTPLNSATIPGRLQRMAVGDVTGDGKVDVVALSKASTRTKEKWLDPYNPTALLYREWLKTPQKAAIAPVIYVWSQGTYGAEMPALPAAYDAIPSKVYLEPFYGSSDPLAVRIVDLAGTDGMGPDGLPDLVISGGTADQLKSNFNLLVNVAPEGDFWDLERLPAPAFAMFKPWNGFDVASEPIYDFALIPDPSGGAIPALAVGMKRHPQLEAECIQPSLRICPWDTAKPAIGDATMEFWSCPIFYEDCQAILGRQIGGQVRDIERVAVEGPLAGSPTEDPGVDSDLVVVNQATNSITYFRHNGALGAFPFEAPMEKGIGTSPKDIALGDVSDDGVVDVVASVLKFVFVAFGQTGSADPFDAPVNIDAGGAEQKGPENTVLSDINADGLPDILWTEKASSRLAVYLNIGPDPKDPGRRRFHGPFYVDLCDGTGDLAVHDFDGDGCEEVLVLCEQAGAVAVLSNDTCRKLAE